MFHLRRPRAVIATIGAFTVTAVAVTLLLSGCTEAPPVSTIGTFRFANPLRVPPLATSTVSSDGTRIFDLTANEGESHFLPGAATPTAGYNGAYLGPTLRATLGEKVEVRVHNKLVATTTLHWHGMHLPAVADGGPHQPIAPGAERDPAWTIDQPAATLWYHPHPHGETEGQVARGLAGMFILDDPAERALPLPRNYGVDDIPVIVQDVAFDSQNRLVQRDGGFVGALGDQLLVDGTLHPHLDVSTDLVRLRLLNASPARVYDFAFSDGRPFSMIASDGGLLDAPVTLDHIQLSPAERAEILVTMAPGERVVLQSRKPDLGIPAAAAGFGGSSGGSDQFDVLQLRAATTLAHAAELPQKLVKVERLDPAAATHERKFSMDGTEINGRAMDMSRIDVVVTLGDTEIWDVKNNMGLPHSFHVHDVQFQLVDIGGAAPPPELAGWKDTIYLRPNTSYRIVLKFTDYADPKHPYMYHCHLLRHEDAGMMGQFLVVEPGTKIPTTTTMEDDNHDHH
ncbi:MAG: multicopper oxidase domain-containing protein [Pseudolysinimonas sp.]